MNPITPQQLHTHARLNGEHVAAGIRAERSRRRAPLATTTPGEVGLAPRRRPSRVRAVAFGALAFVAGGALSRTGGVEAQAPASPPAVVVQTLQAPVCDATVRTTPATPSINGGSHRRYRDRLTPLAV